MQSGIARQSKDLVDAVPFAPRHRLWTARMAIAAQIDVGVRRVAADATHEPANMAGDLSAGWCLAGAQQHRDRATAAVS